MSRPVSKSQLKLMAGLVWYAGAFALIAKAGQLLVSAHSLDPEIIRIWMALGIGIGIGMIKAAILFNKSCRRNLNRINALDRPRIWEFFRPIFFFFLALMIAVGGTLSRMAAGHYEWLIGVAILDLSIGTALLISGRLFWTNDKG
jgi:hypothetical protein